MKYLITSKKNILDPIGAWAPWVSTRVHPCYVLKNLSLWRFVIKLNYKKKKKKAHYKYSPIKFTNKIPTKKIWPKKLQEEVESLYQNVHVRVSWNTQKSESTHRWKTRQIKTITMQYMISQSRIKHVNQIKNCLISIRTVSNIENGTSSIMSKSSSHWLW